MELQKEFSLQYSDYLALFDEHGGTPEYYLSDHYERFRKTFNEFNATWNGGTRVLDIGAHWLHQAVMWRRSGYSVTAVEFPEIFLNPMVLPIANAMKIKLHGCADLGAAGELEAIPDNSADVVLFSEILEHITFNPIALWKQVHRILAPGGRIVVTTPNYYSWKGRAWQPLRFLRGQAGGISVDEVLGLGTYAHHWREYSMGEVKRYFQKLSPDFVITKAKVVPTYMRSRTRWKSSVQAILDTVPLLRPNLHIEVSLPAKEYGIVAQFRY
ncbi:MULTISPECIES: class I SAM-dependent methyltransferase [Stenotrophomonas]|uniref:class I SAM-dependent methyltransferase n=1 Tax=Stenotrophomonas sp. CFBP8994 TaxID=3096527 RepID=UPI002A6AF0BB|nr:methyltransferase domain-containing protein [Stenotrophomonas sp. CFBP8994]MDY0982069.1 methyltransferase domain-containing protein [Stenotrophomonas sp. CFBP8994]